MGIPNATSQTRFSVGWLFSAKRPVGIKMVSCNYESPPSSHAPKGTGKGRGAIFSKNQGKIVLI